MRLEADKITSNNKTGEASAEGKVYLQEKGDVIRADRLQININTKAGMIYNGDLFMSKDNLHLKGEKIERRSETVYHIENGRFTTCDENEWYLKADEIDVDMDRYATGRGVSFNMVGLPVFYTPYLLFPVRRQTGLLIPEVGIQQQRRVSDEELLLLGDIGLSGHDVLFRLPRAARPGDRPSSTAMSIPGIPGARSSSTVFDTFNRYRPERRRAPGAARQALAAVLSASRGDRRRPVDPCRHQSGERLRLFPGP